MYSQERDGKGRFISNNPRSFPMRLTKKERILIEQLRLQEYFSQDPYRFKTKQQTLTKARDVCSVFKEGEIMDWKVLDLYFRALKEFIWANRHHTQIFFDRESRSHQHLFKLDNYFYYYNHLYQSSELYPNPPTTKWEYQIHLRYELPWENMQNEINQLISNYLDPKKNLDGTELLDPGSVLIDLLLNIVKEKLPSIAEYYSSISSKNIYLTVELPLKFRKQLISRLKTIDESYSDKNAEFLIGTTKKGDIVHLWTEEVKSGDYTLHSSQQSQWGDDSIQTQNSLQKALEMVKEGEQRVCRVKEEKQRIKKVDDMLSSSLQETLEILRGEDEGKMIPDSISRTREEDTLNEVLVRQLYVPTEDFAIFTTFTVQEIQQLVKEVDWDYEEPFTMEALHKISELESKALDTFMFLNDLEELAADVSTTKKAQNDDFSRGVVVSFLSNHRGGVPIIVAPHYLRALIFSNPSKKVGELVAEKSFEILDLQNPEDDIQKVFAIQIHGKLHSVFGYAFAIANPEAKDGKENLTICLLSEKPAAIFKNNQVLMDELVIQMREISQLIRESTAVEIVQGALEELRTILTHHYERTIKA
jgi:hypothetical protein